MSCVLRKPFFSGGWGGGGGGIPTGSGIKWAVQSQKEARRLNL